MWKLSILVGMIVSLMGCAGAEPGSCTYSIAPGTSPEQASVIRLAMKDWEEKTTDTPQPLHAYELATDGDIQFSTGNVDECVGRPRPPPGVSRVGCTTQVFGQVGIKATVALSNDPKFAPVMASSTRHEIGHALHILEHDDAEPSVMETENTHNYPIMPVDVKHYSEQWP